MLIFLSLQIFDNCKISKSTRKSTRKIKDRSIRNDENSISPEKLRGNQGVWHYKTLTGKSLADYFVVINMHFKSLFTHLVSPKD